MTETPTPFEFEGGPPRPPRAFPSAAIDDAYGGMTLLDWFAGQALSAAWDIIARCEGDEDDLAREAYNIARAMMLERARRG